MRYRHCIFDLYGTLVDIHTDEDLPQVWERTAAFYSAHGAAYAPEELRCAWLRLLDGAQREAEAPLRRDAHEAYPELQLELIFRQLFLEKGIPASLALAVQAGQVFRRASTRYIRLYEGAKELLTGLRASGQGVWLLSNAQSCFTRMELEELGLLPFFDGILLSSDCGCKKPDPRFFRMLLEKFSIDPAQAIMVGNDGVCDILGAKAVGLDTLYIHSNLSPAEPAPDARFVLEKMDLAAVGRLLAAP